jgi:hypothetical protein
MPDDKSDPRSDATSASDLQNEQQARKAVPVAKL